LAQIWNGCFKTLKNMTVKLTFGIVLFFFLLMFKASTFQNERPATEHLEHHTSSIGVDTRLPCCFEKDFCRDIPKGPDTGNGLTLTDLPAIDRKAETDQAVTVRGDTGWGAAIAGWFKYLMRWINLLIEVS
jgi:hypothetical protein